MPSAQLPLLQRILLQHSPSTPQQGNHQSLIMQHQRLSQEPRLRAQHQPYSIATTTSVSKRLSGQRNQHHRLRRTKKRIYIAPHVLY